MIERWPRPPVAELPLKPRSATLPARRTRAVSRPSTRPGGEPVFQEARAPTTAELQGLLPGHPLPGKK